MSQQIIKQPDGLYALFSTEIDNFILTDVTPEMIVEYLSAIQKQEIETDVAKIITSLEKGKKPYYQFTLTYEEAIARIHDGSDE